MKLTNSSNSKVEYFLVGTRPSWQAKVFREKGHNIIRTGWSRPLTRGWTRKKKMKLVTYPSVIYCMYLFCCKCVRFAYTYNPQHHISTKIQASWFLPWTLVSLAPRFSGDPSSQESCSGNGGNDRWSPGTVKRYSSPSLCGRSSAWISRPWEPVPTQLVVPKRLSFNRSEKIFLPLSGTVGTVS